MRLIITVPDNDPNIDQCLEYALLSPGSLNDDFDDWSNGAVILWGDGIKKILTSTSRTKTGYSIHAYTDRENNG